MSPAASASGGGFLKVIGGFFKGIGGIFKLLFGFLFSTRWRLNWTLFFLVLLILANLGGGIMDVVNNVGGRMLISDNVLWNTGDEVIENKGIVVEEKHDGFLSSLRNGFDNTWAKIKYLFNAIASLWFMYIIIFLIYKVLGSPNTSNDALSWIAAIFAFLVLMMLVSTFFLPGNIVSSDEHKDLKWFEKPWMPARGVIKFGQSVPYIFKSFGGDKILESMDDVNQTNYKEFDKPTNTLIDLA